MPEPVPDPESVLKHSQDRSSSQQYGSRKPQEPILPNEIPKPKTTLDPEVKYLGYLMYGGLTNQVPVYFHFSVVGEDNNTVSWPLFSLFRAQ